MYQVTRRLIVISGLFLGVGSTALARPQAKTGLAIADFEKGLTGLAGDRWFPVDDKQMGGASEARLEHIKPGAASSQAALRVSGSVRTGPFPFPFSGAAGRVAAGRARGEAKGSDLSRYKELRFWARGDGHSFVVQLQSSEIKDFDFHQHAFTPGKEWTEIRVPLTGLQQAGWGAKQPWSNASQRVIGLLFAPKGEPGQAAGEYRLEIDQVSLF
jgi:hypothetical protein